MIHEGTELRMEYNVYGNGRIAIELFSDDYIPYAVATINLPNVALEYDEVIIKNYSENEGIIEMLIKEGIVEKTGRTVPSGMVDVPICRILNLH
jgi:hypothetical protein